MRKKNYHIRNGFPTFPDEVMGVGYNSDWQNRLFEIDRSIRNVACWNCRKEFKDGDIVFCPDGKRDSEVIRGLAFCSFGCAANFKALKRS